MAEFVLNAEMRTLPGKKSRQVGLIPGVYYSHGEGNLSIQVPNVSLDPLVFTSETHIIDLQIKGGERKKCILRDVQFDPVSDRPIHFDLQGLKENEKLEIDIPIVLTGGIAKGVRDGGMIQHLVHKLKVLCLPKDIPSKVEINVAELNINDFVYVHDLKIANVTVLDEEGQAVVGVLPPTVVKEAEVAAAAVEAPKEPEVVGKGKKVEEGEEAAPAKKEPAKKEEKK